MISTRAYAAASAAAPLKPFSLERREPGDHDLLIDIAYCGVCHSDIHQVRDEWGGAVFPMVPGHEIVGVVSRVGKNVKRFKPGDRAGVGCFVDSCRKCPPCRKGLEQFCQVHTAFTYNGTEMDLKTPTFGGYSTAITVDENYALHISPKLPLDRVAPLLCAGITTYSPLRTWKVAKGQHVGIIGLGGLGHMGVKLAASLGAEVTVFSTSPNKELDAKRLGAHHFAVSRDEKTMASLAGRFDFLLDCVSAEHDLNAFLTLLKPDGTLTMVGAPSKPLPVSAFSLIMGRKRLAGSLIGGIPETQEMLDYCAKTGVLADVEVISIGKINDAYERMIRGDVRYRFVIDAKTL